MGNEKAETCMMRSAAVVEKIAAADEITAGKKIAAEKIAAAGTVAADLSGRVGGGENDSGAAMALRDVLDPSDVRETVGLHDEIGEARDAREAAKLYTEVSEARDAREAVGLCDEVGEAHPPDDLLLYAKEFASTAAGQLYLQMQKGDMRAIKLYYDLEERSRRAERTRDEGSGAERMARIAAVRRAVFGEAVMEEDRARAMALAERLALMETEDMPAEIIEDDGDIAADDTEAEMDV